MRTLLILTALASLSACGFGSSDRDSRSERNSSRAERDDGNREEADRSDKGRDSRDRDSRRDEDLTADERQLAQELDEAVRELRRTLPSRDGPITVTDVDLDGLEMIYTGRLDATFTQAQIDQFRREFRTGLCEARDTAAIVRRGAAITYNLTDQEGTEFSTSLARCE
jgi:hypothetical protein